MMLLLMNLPRFVEFMDKKLHIIETENIYVEAGQQKYAHLNVISAWDDGLIYQMVIRVDAGTVQRFVGYSSSADRNLREFGEASDDYAGLEDFLSQHIRRESMYGDFILRRLCVLSTFYRPKEHGKTYHFSSNTRQKSTAG